MNTLPTATLTHKRRVLAILSVCSGNLIEWYDFFIYAYTSIYFSSLFFPSGSQTSQLLATAGIFSAGFFMRPIGGWIFGRIADTRGRKISMLVSIFMMCGGSFMIAAMPTYETLGIMSPAMLVFARLMQGLSVGAEYGTSATYLSEISVKGRRAVIGSFQYFSMIGGQLLALMTIAVLQNILSPDDMKQWGWRVPFLIGAAGAIVVVYLRRSMRETATNAAMHQKESGSLRGLWPHRRAVLLTFLLTIGCSLYYYTFTAYMQKFLTVSAGIPAPTVTLIMTAALVLFMLAQPFFGMLADRLGSRTHLIIFSGLAAVCVIPLMTAIRDVHDPYQAFFLVLCGMLIAAFYTPVTGVLKADFYPASVRALGVGLPYAIGAALCGGSAEFVALSFRATGNEQYFFIYVAAITAVTFLASVAMPDLRKHGYLDGDGQVEANTRLIKPLTSRLIAKFL